MTDNKKKLVSDRTLQYLKETDNHSSFIFWYLNNESKRKLSYEQNPRIFPFKS